MVKHHTVARKYNPVRSKRRRSRRRKSRHSEQATCQTENSCFTITLRDVGDIDDKELNTVPSSIQGETSSWVGEAEGKNNDSSFAHNPLLQIESGDFCHLCTMRMLDIHDLEGGIGNECDHNENIDGRRNHVAQSIMKVFQSITEGRFNDTIVEDVQHNINAEQRQEKIQTKLMTKKCRTLSKAINTSNREMAGSLSRLSIQVMCTSESTLSTGLTQDPNSVVVWPPQEKLNPKSIVTKKKLETVAGALLMELCKVTAEKIDQNTPPASQKKFLLAKDSFMPRLEKARHAQLTTGYSELDTRFSDWLRELCRQKNSSEPKRGILKKARSQIEKSKINIFRPLLCTKLSIPWLLPKSLPQIACKKQRELEMLKRKRSSVEKHSKNQNHQRSNKDRTRESKKENFTVSAGRDSNCSETVSTKIVHAYDTRNVHYRSSDSVMPSEGSPAPIEVPLRLFASKTIGGVKFAKKMRPERQEDRDSVEDKTASHKCSNSRQDCREVGRVTEKRVKEVCPKCQSSIQCSIAFRRNSHKLRKIKTKPHNILAYPCKKIVKKTKPSSRQEKSLRHQLERSRENCKTRRNGDPTTKYFIKSFFTGTSTSETTKPALKTAKKVGRRKKIVPPRMSGRAIPQDAKKRRASPSSRRHHGKVDTHDSNSDVELEIQASEEMDIINQHIRAHKTASESSQVFHTCFKHLLDKELKAQQSSRGSKPSKSRKIAKGGYFAGRPVPEVKMFNEGIFSCLIPKVFK